MELEENRTIQLTFKAFEKEKDKILLQDNLVNLDIEVVFIDELHSVLYAL